MLLCLGLLLGVPALAAESNATPAPAPQRGAFERSPIILVLEDEGALSADEPMYFVVGAADEPDADVIGRFQVSFKYRVFDPGSVLGRELTAARNLYFAFTQTSLWNLSEESRPFEDTTYRPRFFWQDVSSGHGLAPDAWRFGFEHASNGQAEERSRSVNTLFLRLGWWTEVFNREFVVAPQVFAYLDKSENPDIHKYQGNINWLVRYGTEESWAIDARFGGTSTSKNSIELNLSYPIRDPLFYRAGGFIYLQYFEGYGESLLEYNIKTPPTLRLGFAMVR